MSTPKIFHLIFLILPLLLPLTTSTTLIGRWRLEIDDSYTRIDKNSSIVFEFESHVENGTVVSGMSVFACSLLEFGFEIEDNLASFYFGGKGVKRKDCASDEDSEIITRLEKVTFNIMIGNSLLLLSPTGKNLLKLTKIQDQSILRTLLGIWQVTQLQQQPVSIIVRANSSTIQFCEGKATILYNIPKQNKFLTRFQSVKGCQENDLLNSLYHAAIARQFNEDQIWFYGDDATLLMKWTNLAKGEDGPIVFPSSIKVQSSMMQPIDSSQSSTTASSSSQPASSTVSSAQPQTLSTQTQASIYNIFVSIQTEEPKTVVGNLKSQQSILTSQAFLPQSGSSSLSESVYASVSSSAIPPIISTSLSQPQSSPSASASSSDSSSSQKQAPSTGEQSPKNRILKRWFFNKQMTIISNTMVLIYASCGVWMLPISISTNQSKQNQIDITHKDLKNSDPRCPLDRSLAFLSNLAGFRLRGEGDSELVLFDARDQELRIWTKAKL